MYVYDLFTNFSTTICVSSVPPPREKKHRNQFDWPTKTCENETVLFDECSFSYSKVFVCPLHITFCRNSELTHGCYRHSGPLLGHKIQYYCQIDAAMRSILLHLISVNFGICGALFPWSYVRAPDQTISSKIEKKKKFTAASVRERNSILFDLSPMNAPLYFMRTGLIDTTRPLILNWQQ